MRYRARSKCCKNEIEVRTEVQDSLRKSEERYRSLVIATSQIVWTTGANGELCDDIPLWRAFTGQRKDEMKGSGWTAAIHPEDMQRVTTSWAAAVEKRSEISIEFRVRRHDGEYRYFDVRGVPVLGGDGTIREWVGCSNDITERKRIEDDLKKRKMELDESQRVAQLGSWDWDAVTGTVTCSDEYYRILAVDATSSPNVPGHLEIYTAESAARLEAAITRAMEVGEPYDLELELALPAEGRRWVQSRGEGKRDMAGKITGGRGTVQNITERRQAEDTLLLLSAAIEQSPVTILITDSKGNIEFVNPKFSQLTGYTSAEAMGRNPSILKSAETPRDVYRELWETITSGRVWQGELCNRKKNGELYHERATVSPVKNRQGKIANFIAIKEDITDHRSLEHQLRHSQKMEAIGTLSGGIAHDFNNLLTVIIGFASILEMKMAKDDPLTANVGQILAAANRATNMTRSLLAFSRKQAMEKRVVDLNAILAGLEKMLQRLIREDIELSITPAESELLVLVDACQIEQVLINLVTNSLDAMPEGGRMTISSAETTMDESFQSAHGYGLPGRYALLVVTDNGVGMDEHVCSRIFDPFFTTKGVGKGTGLGLSVCYGILKAHGGYINCFSEPGRGTTFHIYLPLDQSTPEPVAPQTGFSNIHGKETILLAEDEPIVRALVASILTEFGYSVIEAVDGEDAVARFKECPDSISLCLFDVMMPKKKGGEAYELIRKIRADVKVLFMSGYQQDCGMVSELTASGVGFIAKPVLPNKLLQTIREQLDK